MSGAGRAIGASCLALFALVLIGVGGPRAVDAYRAQRAVPAPCSHDLALLPAGTWISLISCSVDKFRSSSFRDDASGVTYVLAPLRGPDDDLDDPSPVALAYTVDGSPVRLLPHEDDQLYTLRDLTGVVIGGMDGLTGAHLESAEIESGLAPGAVVIEARVAPDAQEPLTLLAGGGVFMALAAWVALRGRGEGSAVAGVRWGLVAVLLIVSLAASLRGLQWFMDPMRQTDAAAARNQARPASQRLIPVGPAGLVEPTADDIEALQSADALVRLRAADTLMQRAVTPAVIAAVDRALDIERHDDFRRKLVCLKARFPGPDTLEFLLWNFPNGRGMLNWTLTPDVKCMLDGLAARTAEDPQRVRDALVAGAFSDNAAVRATVQSAFRTIDIAVPPLEILKALASSNPWEYRYGLEAALALGAVRHNQGAVQRAAEHHDPAVRSVVRHELISNPHANAARIVARRWLDVASGPGEEARIAVERERAQHDVSAVLAEVVTDPRETDARRAVAVRRMVELDEIGVVPVLDALYPELAPGELRDAVTLAISHFDPKRRRPHRMRALTP